MTTAIQCVEIISFNNVKNSVVIILVLIVVVDSPKFCITQMSQRVVEIRFRHVEPHLRQGPNVMIIRGIEHLEMKHKTYTDDCEVSFAVYMYKYTVYNQI